MKQLWICATIMVLVSFFSGMWVGAVHQAQTTDEVAVCAQAYIDRLESDITRITKEENEYSEYMLDVMSECDEYCDWYMLTKHEESN